MFPSKSHNQPWKSPEGVFYNMRDFNLYVVKKNAQTGMLYNTIIYKMDQGFDRAQIVLADSAK